MPSLAVSRNSPLYNNLATFLHRMIENGLFPSYIQWINGFVVESTDQDMIRIDKKKTPEVVHARHILKYFLGAFVIQMMVFTGELLCHRWQVRRA